MDFSDTIDVDGAQKAIMEPVEGLADIAQDVAEGFTLHNVLETFNDSSGAEKPTADFDRDKPGYLDPQTGLFDDGKYDQISARDANMIAQGGLELMGFKPNGVDGALGKGSQGAWDRFAKAHPDLTEDVQFKDANGVVTVDALKALEEGLAQQDGAQLAQKISHLAQGDTQDHRTINAARFLQDSNAYTGDMDVIDPKAVEEFQAEIGEQEPDTGSSFNFSAVFDAVAEVPGGIEDGIQSIGQGVSEIVNGGNKGPGM